MMTQLEQRIALAEWLGWHSIEHVEAATSDKYSLVGIDSYCVMSYTLMDKHQDNEIKPWKKYVPNYPNDLNACHEVEKKLLIAQHETFRNELARITTIERGPKDILQADYYSSVNERAYISTTSQQRTEALCRTLFPERFE